MERYKVRKVRKGKERIIEGTLDELKRYFSYTLEVGHSLNGRINKDPKNIGSFISNLQRAYEEKEACCYERTYVCLV